MDEILEGLQNSIYEGDVSEAEKLAMEALSIGIEPLVVINNGLKPGVDRIGNAYSDGKIFLPELIGGGNAALSVSAIVEKSLSKTIKKVSTLGTFAIGTVKDDIHSIGKDIVSIMIKASGFKVIDLGVNVSTEKFLEVAPKVDVIGLSCLLSVALGGMKETIQKLSDRYPHIILIIGGAIVNRQFAQNLDVFYGSDAATAPIIVKQALESRRHDNKLK